MCGRGAPGPAFLPRRPPRALRKTGPPSAHFRPRASPPAAHPGSVCPIKIIFSYVERNHEFAAQQVSDSTSSPSSHRHAPKRNYLFSRRLREEDISICDALLDGGGDDPCTQQSAHSRRRSHSNRRRRRQHTPEGRQHSRSQKRGSEHDRYYRSRGTTNPGYFLDGKHTGSAADESAGRRKVTVGGVPTTAARLWAKHSLQGGVVLKQLDSERLSHRTPSPPADPADNNNSGGGNAAAEAWRGAGQRAAPPPSATTTTRTTTTPPPLITTATTTTTAAAVAGRGAAPAPLPTVRRTPSGRLSVENGAGFRAADAAALVGQPRYRAHAGKNRFCLGGRILMAEQNGAFYVTLALIFATMTSFFAFDAVYIAERVSIALPIGAALLFLLVMANLLKTSFTDPGIIPRASNKEVIEQERLFKIETGNPNATTPRTRMIEVFNECIVQKYCFTCRIFRPPRASHCSVCDNCVLRFDHHCPWVGNCVGLRNYRNFYMFVVLLTVLDFLVGSCAIAHLVLLCVDSRTFLNAVRLSPGSLFVALVCLVSVWSVLGLSGFHTYLLASNQTTNEEVKDAFGERWGTYCGSLYSSGNLVANCCAVLCAPEPPSLLERRARIAPATLVTVQPDWLQRRPRRPDSTLPEPRTHPTPRVQSPNPPQFTVIPRAHHHHHHHDHDHHNHPQREPPNPDDNSSIDSTNHSTDDSYTSSQVQNVRDDPAQLDDLSSRSSSSTSSFTGAGPNEAESGRASRPAPAPVPNCSVVEVRCESEGGYVNGGGPVVNNT